MITHSTVQLFAPTLFTSVAMIIHLAVQSSAWTLFTLLAMTAYLTIQSSIQTQYYFVHRHRNNTWYNKARSLIGKPYLVIIASNAKYQECCWWEKSQIVVVGLFCQKRFFFINLHRWDLHKGTCKLPSSAKKETCFLSNQSPINQSTKRQHQSSTKPAFEFFNFFPGPVNEFIEFYKSNDA